MTLPIRIDLVVPFARKDEAKALGARWDAGQRTWYAPPGTNLRPFDRRWLPKGCEVEAAATTSSSFGEAAAKSAQGISLSELLNRVRGLVNDGLPDAIWVRAEISEFRSKNGHHYLTLTERDERGAPLANSKGVIFRNRADAISAKFQEAAGEGLRADIKILCLAKVRFDPLYGLDLLVEDVDPSYTLGDLAAKLARIRQRLVEDDLYEQNKALPAPHEFVRVAVISPETSAGLGDFRRETDLLQDAGLCTFGFYPATFQGVDASPSIRSALDAALVDHGRRPFDVLAIIRGGGAVTDLAWLNDLELAQAICRAPLPVFTGIGHERDGTILDEVAHRRFDTPSKVALHLTTTIKDNALAAVTAVEQIGLQVARILNRERTALATLADRVEAGVRSMTRQADTAQHQFLGTIRTAARYQVREARHDLEAEYVRLIGTADSTTCEAGLGLKRSMEALTHRSQLILTEQRATTEQEASAVVLRATVRVEAAARELEHQRDRMDRDVTRMIDQSAGDVECDVRAVAEGIRTLVEAARREVETSTRIVVGLGPQATLARGFSIARDAERRPITSREAALERPEFAVQFHDGTVAVAVLVPEGGEDR